VSIINDMLKEGMEMPGQGGRIQGIVLVRGFAIVVTDTHIFQVYARELSPDLSPHGLVLRLLGTIPPDPLR
jgi:hypothetical protein